LTEREREIIDLLRAEPLLGAAALADRLGSTKAAVAVHLSNLTRKGAIVGRGYVLRPQSGGAVVVGGLNLDIRARAEAAARLGTSNPGTALTAPGGVGRNLAENLARLGTSTQLVAAVGRDEFGAQVLAATRAAGVLLDGLVVGEEPTGTYLAVLGPDGDLLVAVSNMSATDHLTVADLQPSRDRIAHADVLVIDGNLPVEVVGWLLDTAAAGEVPVVLDPVSVAKAARIAAVLSPRRPILLATPNADELAALTGRTDAGEASRVARSELGIANLWVRRGPDGSTLHAEDGASHRLAAPPTTVVDVTGAGDSGTAGWVHAWLGGASILEAAAFGQVCSALTVACPSTVRSDLSDSLVRTHLDFAERIPPAPLR
jgi:pseudouridine kinase